MEKQEIISVTIGGQEYPAYLTMGAMTEYERITGRSFGEYAGTVTDLAAYLYGCVKWASRAEGVEFKMSFDDFLVRFDLGSANELAERLNLNPDSAEPKKK